jgi:DNA-binding MarR family transcriptional regulator
MNHVPKLDDLACFALYSASRAMTGAYHEYLSALGLTYPQYLVLVVLWEEDGARVSRIGERLFLDSATLTPVLKRLETRGLLERRRSTADERVVEVFLTVAGKRLQKKAGEVSEGFFCKTQLSLPELIRLRDSLQELTKNLHDAEAKRAG